MKNHNPCLHFPQLLHLFSSIRTSIRNPKQWVIFISILLLFKNIFLHSIKLTITYVHSLLPRPFILMPCLMHSVRFPFFYYLLFLPETFFYAHRNCRFISIGLVPLCTIRLIIKYTTRDALSSLLNA